MALEVQVRRAYKIRWDSCIDGKHAVDDWGAVAAFNSARQIALDADNSNVELVVVTETERVIGRFNSGVDYIEDEFYQETFNRSPSLRQMQSNGHADLPETGLTGVHLPEVQPNLGEDR